MPEMRCDLRIGYVSRRDALAAVRKWHYSKTLPRFQLVSFGCWEDDEYIGAVIFGGGATPELHKRFGVRRHEACELVRVALKSHQWPTSKIVATAVRKFVKDHRAIKIIVSFADTAQGHHGGIYQAMNWTYMGESVQSFYKIRGQLVHPKSLHSKYGIGGQSIAWLKKHVDRDAERVTVEPKHRYVFLVDKSIKVQGLPYPKRTPTP